ncbi:MAG: TIGR03790 family protein [Bryobacteraceae bacterium]
MVGVLLGTGTARRHGFTPAYWLCLLVSASGLFAQTGENVLLVVNRRDRVSREIGDYYRPPRSVPVKNVCYLDATSDEEIPWDTYLREVEQPIARCLQQGGLREKILYIVLTKGVPLKVDGSGGSIQTAEHASVDSELSLLYGKLHGAQVGREGVIGNPFSTKRDMPFRHPEVPIYMVTRLAAFSLEDVKAMIDRALAARNRGKFVIDLSGPNNAEGNNWLRNAAMLLPRDRVLLDETTAQPLRVRDVIAYASWGSNDGRIARTLGYSWLAGAVATEYVSTNARTLQRPPAGWLPTTWEDRAHFFAGSPQSLSADYLSEGATAVTGNTYEPYLQGCARPDYLLPAYYQGRNLAESYYLSIPFLSWQGVLLGDPLCSLGKP